MHARKTLASSIEPDLTIVDLGGGKQALYIHICEHTILRPTPSSTCVHTAPSWAEPVTPPLYDSDMTLKFCWRS